MARVSAIEEIREGTEIPSLAVNFSLEMNARYCVLVREINPLHFDRDFARSLGYKDIVIAGVFTASFFPKLLTDWLGDAIRIQTIRLTFRAPAYVNETVTYKGRVTGTRAEQGARTLQCELWSENAAGQRLAEATVLASF